MRVFGGPSNLSGMRRLEIGYEYLLAVNTGMLEAMSIIQTGIQQIGQQLAQEKMKLTVQHLPDEILMHIFEFVFDDEDRFTAIQLQETFPLVCRRWRTLVYAIPRFWNKIYSFQSPRYVDACLGRSKGTGLDLYMETTKLDSETGKDMFTEAARFCAQLLPHSQRWESFSLVADASRSTALTLFNSIRVHSGSLQLPNLHSMHITWTSMDVTSDEELLNNDDLHFYSSWGMPQLSKLVVDNFIPRLLYWTYANFMRALLRLTSPNERAIIVGFFTKFDSSSRAQTELSIHRWNSLAGLGCTSLPAEPSKVVPGVQRTVTRVCFRTRTLVGYTECDRHRYHSYLGTLERIA